MVGTVDLSRPLTQAAFGELVGISQQAVSDFIKVAALGPGVSGAEMLQAYCERLREVAAGRASSEIGGLDLVQERAALAREQRLGYEIKNAVARKTYAPISLLAETLATASQAVVERFDHLPGTLKKSCPELPAPALDQVLTVIAEARNAWVTGTQRLLAEQLSTEEADAAPGEEEEPEA